MSQWSKSDANAWHNARAWVCGFNFLPSSAVNFLEMWHPDTFDRDAIERELGWAAEIGFNAFRINLHYLIWKHDRDGLLDRLDWIMDVAHRLGIDTVPCLFDDCGFGGFEPEYGPQPDPVPDVHNSRAVASPGRALVASRDDLGGLEAYVRDVISVFRADKRVLFWDLYNEPGNLTIIEATGSRNYEPDFTKESIELMRSSFEWCRSADPEQPATVAAWKTPLPGSDDDPYQTEADQLALEMSDIVTFHAYWDAAHVRRFIDHLSDYQRPMICTEWMARSIRSLIADQLELFRSRQVGCFQWGLVQGRTQTYLPWPAEQVAAHGGHDDRSVWFHDLLDISGQPYDSSETATIKRLTSLA